MAETPPYRVALAGGGIGRQHLDAFGALPELFEVTVICEPEPTRAADLAARAGGCRTVADVADILADDAVDIVDICLPPRLHHGAVLAALRAGKHVICEKPLAGSLAEVDEMAAAADAAGRRLYPVFQYRFGAGLTRLRHLMAEGLTGRPSVASVETHWDRDAGYYGVPWRGRWQGELGGAVLSHAIHAHDLIETVLGPIVSVSAQLATRVNEIEVDDCAALALQTAGGALVTSSITLGAAGNSSRLRFCFDRLTAESTSSAYHPAGGDWTFTARGTLDPAELAAACAAAPVGKERYEGLFTEIGKDLAGRPNGAVGPAEGRRSIELVTAIYESARTGRRITLPLGRDLPLYRGWQPKSIP